MRAIVYVLILSLVLVSAAFAAEKGDALFNKGKAVYDKNCAMPQLWPAAKNRSSNYRAFKAVSRGFQRQGEGNRSHGRLHEETCKRKSNRHPSI